VHYGDDIISRTTGAHTRHAASLSDKGPASVALPLPGMPGSEMATNERFTVVDRFGQAIQNVTHEIENGQGQTESGGGTDDSGSTPELGGKTAERLKMHLE
jgi:uncharacterized protein (DUF2345 family)